VIVTLVPEIDPVLGTIRSTTGESGPLVFVVGVGATVEPFPHATAVARIAAHAQIRNGAVIEESLLSVEAENQGANLKAGKNGLK
jgi:hypothetical protein